MSDLGKVIKAYEDFVNGYECFCISDDYEYEMHKAVLALLKKQEDALEQMRLDNTDLRNCNAELMKAQEAVVPHYNARTNWYECGNCHYSMTSGMHCRSELIPATKVRYCANCGFPVNWEGR